MLSLTILMANLACLVAANQFKSFHNIYVPANGVVMMYFQLRVDEMNAQGNMTVELQNVVV